MDRSIGCRSPGQLSNSGLNRGSQQAGVICQSLPPPRTTRALAFTVTNPPGSRNPKLAEFPPRARFSTTLLRMSRFTSRHSQWRWAGWLADRRFLLLLVASFAVAGLVLVAVGLYGAIAYFVTRRTQEIGIRMAIGAQRSDVLLLVIGEGARSALVGVVIGVAASPAITRLLSRFLFNTSATDPLTFAGVALLLCLVTLAASYIPARSRHARRSGNSGAS